jgi:hypothetical protein
MLDAAITGHSLGKFDRSNRFSILRLRFFRRRRILVFTRKPSMRRVAGYLTIPKTQKNAESFRVFSFFQKIITKASLG